ncbi:MAG: hypothetical protein R3C01_02060 [Planctomycetaceae bacterium]
MAGLPCGRLGGMADRVVVRTGEEAEVIAFELSRLCDAVGCVTDVLEEIREDIAWGIQNGRVIISLAEVEGLRHTADATVDGSLVEMTLRLHTHLLALREDLSRVVESQQSRLVSTRPEPSQSESSQLASSLVSSEINSSQLASSEPPSSELPSTQPVLTLYEIGDAVEFTIEGDDYFGEIVERNDATNEVIVLLLPDEDHIYVSQDLLRLVEPDALQEFVTRVPSTRSMDESSDVGKPVAQTAPSEGTLPSLEGNLVETALPSFVDQDQISSTPTVDTPPDLSNVVESDNDETPEERQAAYRRWCHDVRDPAIESSEGRRTVATTKDAARLEYEIAPLPSGLWAANWQYGYLGGSQSGVGHPWTTFPSREACLEEVLRSARQYFAKDVSEAAQKSARKEMQQQLGDGLFGFIEPEPVRDVMDVTASRPTNTSRHSS